MDAQVADERLGNVLSMDIYGLSWYTLYQMEVQGKPSAKYNVDNVYLYLRALMEEDRDVLHVALYDKEVAVGVLLGYYVLLKSKFYSERNLRQGLFRVLKVIKSYIDDYAAGGEVLYALKKLDTVTGLVKEFINVDDRIRGELSKLKDNLLKDSLRIEEAEDISYIIWVVCETAIYDKNGEKNLLEIILNDRLYNLVAVDYKSAPVYANALSNIILKCKFKIEEEIYDVLYEKTEELIKTLGFYVKEFEKEENVDMALVGKLKLGVYNLEKALRKLGALDEVQRTKRKYGILLAITIASIIAFLLTLYVAPQVLLSFLFSNMSIIIGALLSILIIVVDSTLRKSKILELIKLLSNIIINAISKVKSR